MKCFKCLCDAWAKIPFVDKCLCAFLAILLGQSAYSLFSVAAASSNSNIDVIVRTSTAAIFGYFLSANFGRTSTSNSQKTSSAPPQTLDSSVFTSPAPQARIGFKSPASGEPGDLTALPPAKPSSQSPKHIPEQFQAMAATLIGLFCLITLLVLQNFPALSNVTGTQSEVATIAQFRDFVSGCIGFLIGYPTQDKD